MAQKSVAVDGTYTNANRGCLCPPLLRFASSKYKRRNGPAATVPVANILESQAVAERRFNTFFFVSRFFLLFF